MPVIQLLLVAALSAGHPAFGQDRVALEPIGDHAIQVLVAENRFLERLSSFGQASERPASVRFEVGASMGGGKVPSGAFTGALFAGELPGEEGARVEARVLVPPGAGHLWVRVIEPGFSAIRSFRRITRATDHVSLAPVVREGVTARGRAVTEGGDPIQAQWLWLSGDVQGHSVSEYMDGTFEAHYRRPGRAELAGRFLDGGSCVVDLGELDLTTPPQDLELVSRGRGQLSWAVVDGKGRPLPGIEIRAIHRDLALEAEANELLTSRRDRVHAEGRLYAALRTDRSGACRIGGLLEGNWYIFARPRRGQPWRRIQQEPLRTGDGVQRLTMAVDRLIVRLIDAHGGPQAFRPARVEDSAVAAARWVPGGDGLRVALEPVGGARFQGPSLGRGSRREDPAYEWFPTRDPTCWELSIAQGQPHWLRASATDRVSKLVKVELHAGEGAQRLDLVLGAACRPATLMLRVPELEGEEEVTLSHYGVTLFANPGPVLGSGLHAIGAGNGDAGEGFEREIVLPPGSYRLRVRPIPFSERFSCISGLRPIPPPRTVNLELELLPGEHRELRLGLESRAYVMASTPEVGATWDLVRKHPGTDAIAERLDGLDPAVSYRILIPREPWLFEFEARGVVLGTALFGDADGGFTWLKAVRRRE